MAQLELNRREDSRTDTASLPFILASDKSAFILSSNDITSDSLPFALAIREDSQSNNASLPFAFAEDSSGGGDPTLPNKIGRCLIGSIEPVYAVTNCHAESGRSYKVAQCFSMDYGVTITVEQCQSSLTEHLPRIANCHNSDSEVTDPVEACHFGRFADVHTFKGCLNEDSERVVPLTNCAQDSFPAPVVLKNCAASHTPPAIPLFNCYYDLGLAVVLYSCFSSDNVPTLPVPCDWYEIELPPVDPPYEWPCGEPPPSDRLPLAFARPATQGRDSDILPMPFVCHYTPEPNRKRTYMIYNNVSAEIDGQPIGIYTAKINTSMDSFCWQFDIEIRHDDFAKLNLDTRADDPLMTITINGHQWIMLVEDYGERKAFNRDSYTLTGRSRTALLTGDYAKRKTQLINTALNASQLAQQQLAGLPFTLVYDSDADWFIPADTYTVSGTPIETIMDIAEAGGHYVASHPTDPILYIRKRWPREAWAVNSNDADRQLSALTWLSLTGNRNISTRYNSVRLAGSGANAKGGYIYRQINAGDKTPEAGAISHVLYAGDTNNTPVAAFRNKGIQVLSDSGKHKIYSVQHIWADDTTNPENLPLSQLQEVLEIMDTGGSLGKGVVTGVSIDIGENNDATQIMQTATVNVYLGD